MGVTLGSVPACTAAGVGLGSRGGVTRSPAPALGAAATFSGASFIASLI